MSTTPKPPEPFHPDLAAARRIPRFSVGRRSLWLFNIAPRGLRSTDDVHIATVPVAGEVGTQPYRVFRPIVASKPRAALLWIHGGGLVFGTPQQDDATNLELARELDIVVFSAAYRLAPKHPAPAALDDVVSGYRDLLARADEFGIDPNRIVIGGASAGGGLAASLAQRLHDEGGPQPVFQLLVYPMLDDRTNLRDDIDTRHVRMWSPASNVFGWTSYLQMDAANPDVPAEFVPARRDDLTGLPPAWIGVGSLDLFHDEDVEYARRLEEAGVPCVLTVVAGAFHGFDAIFSKANVSKRFHAEWAQVLRGALAESRSDS
ncbi:alpha/beta hydrolase (plasmid) [Coraliomargarita sp. W4R53]